MNGPSKVEVCKNEQCPVPVPAGGIYADDDSSVVLVDSVLQSNYVKDYYNKADGGACYLYGSASLTLNNTLVQNNTAQNIGGGVAMGSPE